MRICSLTPKRKDTQKETEYCDEALTELANELRADGAVIHGPEYPNSFKWKIKWP